jgi:signal peptidase
MARLSSKRHDDDEEEPSDEDDSRSSRASHSTRPSGRRGAHSRGVRPWSPGEAGDDDEEDDDPEDGSPGKRKGFFHREREPVYFRARDSLFFEPLVALAIIVVLLVGLFAYTQNWPPMYVVESESMQHGTVDQLGLINTGDLVLAQKVTPGQIVPYMVGLQTGYQTYGEFGDVVLYHPNGLSGTPIIHRALLYIFANPDGRYSVPGLNGLPCGSAPNADFRSGSSNGCATNDIAGTLTLLHIGWRSVTVSVSLDSLGSASGFLTMGDNNFDPSDPSFGTPDEPGLTSLVENSWVVGVARGMLPWFGSLKLLLEGNANEVPPQSWQFLGITIVSILLLAFGLHYVARLAGRRGEVVDDDTDDDEESDDAEDHPSRFRGFRLWRTRSDEGDEDDSEEDDSDAPARPGRGRPRPSVKKPAKGHGHSPTSEHSRRP